jgi:xanthine dehydrogenase YagS FAD-binding subunit
LQNGAEERLIKLDEFYLLPGDTPDRENQLRPGELITEVHVPALPWARRSAYLKIRDRKSYEFALTSAAVALDVDGDKIRDVRLAVGGVGTKPWNLPKVREALAGKSLEAETLTAAAKLAISDATPLKQNGFKVELLQRTIVRAFMNLGDLA